MQRRFSPKDQELYAPLAAAFLHRPGLPDRYATREDGGLFCWEGAQ